LSEAAALKVAERYITWVQATAHSHSGEQAAPLVQLESPSGSATKPGVSGMIGAIMAGILIFFVFFTGANSAAMIIQEEEDGTLARLYTTPTSLTMILGGKFVSVLITLALQTFILLFAARLIFSIQWGAPATVLLVILALVIAASGFGILVMSSCTLHNKRALYKAVC
jgi:ABC-type multidrug transport system permease subunit